MSKLKKLEEAIKSGRASKGGGGGVAGIARRRRGIAGGMRGRGCPAGHFLHRRHPAMTQVRRPRLTPPAFASNAFRALCVPGLPGLPCSPCFCLGALPSPPGRKELAEFQFSLEAMGLQREADAELPSAPLEAVGVGRGIGGIKFPVILPLFDQSPQVEAGIWAAFPRKGRAIDHQSEAISALADPKHVDFLWI